MQILTKFIELVLFWSHLYSKDVYVVFKFVFLFCDHFWKIIYFQVWSLQKVLGLLGDFFYCTERPKYTFFIEKNTHILMFIAMYLNAFGAERQQTLLFLTEIRDFFIRMESAVSFVISRRSISQGCWSYIQQKIQLNLFELLALRDVSLDWADQFDLLVVIPLIFG